MLGGEIRIECFVKIKINVRRTIQALFENDCMGDECDQHRQSREDHAAELIQVYVTNMSGSSDVTCLTTCTASLYA